MIAKPESVRLGAGARNGVICTRTRVDGDVSYHQIESDAMAAKTDILKVRGEPVFRDGELVLPLG